MANAPKPASPARPAPPAAPLAASQAVDPSLSKTPEEIEAEKKAQEDAAAEAQKLADQQAKQHRKGASGQEAADKAKGGKAAKARHTITDPKAAPVDYTAETMRRPPHTVLPVDKAEPKAVAVSPYGSEPMGIDLETGRPIQAAPTVEAGDEDERDADTDRGESAAQRAAS